VTANTGLTSVLEGFQAPGRKSLGLTFSREAGQLTLSAKGLDAASTAKLQQALEAQPQLLSLLDAMADGKSLAFTARLQDGKVLEVR